jgi:hypothetical protein
MIMAQVQWPNCNSYYTCRSGLIGCWTRSGVWFGWIIALVSTGLLWAARIAAFVNVKSLELGLVGVSMVIVFAGLTLYLLRPRAGRAWACISCKYRWRQR